MKKPQNILNEVWGHQAFRGSQENIINTLLRGKDVLALMPTGGGKSLCYQIPALCNEGICIVVSPLVALIQNQVASLKDKGIKALAIAGGISFEELTQSLDNCIYGGYKFLYVSPERLQQSIVQERMAQMNVNLIAIDEAHCISQWGNDFRPAYLKCSILKELLPKTPMIALTATATTKVSHDIVKNLSLDNPLISRNSFLRKNLSFQVKKTQDKQYYLFNILQSVDGSSIVYVGTRKKSEAISRFLKKKKMSVDFFHGGLSVNEKKTKLDKWLSEEIRIIVATSAFGMGIDKANVRSVVHYQMPESLENYFQEAGRAGRDGKPASILLLTNKDDTVEAKKQYIDRFPNTAFLKQLYKNLNNHFQIAYGEGSNLTFDLNFSAFCSKYELNPHLTHTSLKLLDQHSVLALSEAFRRQSSLKFLAKKERLFDYMQQNTSIQVFIQSLLRTYGGLFDFDTYIDLGLLQKKTALTEKEVLEALQKLKTEGIIASTINKTDLGITFLVPREDEKTLNPISHKIKILREQKVERFQKMLAYIENQSMCRSSFLLKYFGEENDSDCGFCDICIANNENQHLDSTNIKNTLLKLLKKEAKNSRELASLLKIDENQVLTALKELLEDELLTLTKTNAYKIK